MAPDVTVVEVGNALDLPGYPISPATVVGDRVETAGVLPIDPRTGDLVAGDITAQTAQALDNLAAILAAAGSSTDRLLFVDVALADPGRDFAGFNEAYAARLRAPYPPRRTIGATLALPGLLVELRASAVIGGSR